MLKEANFLFFDIANTILTAANKQVLSRRAPTQPANPMIKVIIPVHIKINAGSNAIVVILAKLLKVSFSVHAHTPTAKIQSPVSCKKKKHFRIKYFTH